MSGSQDLAAKVEQRLAELAAGTAPEQADQRSLARHLHARPLYADVGGRIAIRLTAS